MGSKSRRIQAKVARTLGDRDLVLNKGSKDGVKAGMTFAIVFDSREEILDPDTGEVIGSIARPKVEVEVREVGEGISIARTNRFDMVNVGGSGLGTSGISGLFTPPKYIKRYETFDFEESESTEEESKESTFVKIGDAAVEVDTGDDDTDVISGVILSSQAE